MTLQEILQYFSKEWAVLMSAPRTFVVLLVVGVVVGYAASSWYYSGVVSAKSAQLEQKEAQLARYKVALGVDKASSGALIELTNAEMKAKAATTSAKLRNLHQSLERQSRQVQSLRTREN